MNVNRTTHLNLSRAMSMPCRSYGCSPSWMRFISRCSDECSARTASANDTALGECHSPLSMTPFGPRPGIRCTTSSCRGRPTRKTSSSSSPTWSGHLTVFRVRAPLRLSRISFKRSSASSAVVAALCRLFATSPPPCVFVKCDQVVVSSYGGGGLTVSSSLSDIFHLLFARKNKHIL
jgi:hypothetical protein